MGSGVVVPIGLVDRFALVEEGDAVDVLEVEANAVCERGIGRLARVNVDRLNVQIVQALEV